MYVTFRQGDVLLVAPVALQQVRPGDVIAFRKRTAGGVVVMAHRVCSRTEAELITRGDQYTTADREVVDEETLVGRVCFVQRDNKARPVWGGYAGQLWVAFLRLRQRLVQWSSVPYRLLRASGLVGRLWRPRLAQIHLTSEDGPLVKYVHGQRTVAYWWPENGRFWCRKPYDLVIERPAGCAHRRD